jgi:hypothetical protein
LALSWVVSHAVYAPGRITFHRLQGAAVLYLNAAIIFAAAFTLIWELSPAAFSSPTTATGELGEFATMLYFSLATLTAMATSCRWIRLPAAWPIWSRFWGHSISPSRLPDS